MAEIINISTESPFNNKGLQEEKGKIINKTFGRDEDILEVHIYDLDNNLLDSDYNYKDYSLPQKKEEDSTPLNVTTKEPKIVNPKARGAGEKDYKRSGPNNSKDGYWFNTGYEMVWVSTALNVETKGEELPSEISMDPVEFLNDNGYNEGKYNLKLNFQRQKIYNIEIDSEIHTIYDESDSPREEKPFQIKEISPSRREIRVISPKEPNETFDGRIKGFLSEMENSSYFKEFILNFNNDLNIVGINILLNKNSEKHEILIKTLEPLPSSINTLSYFHIIEPIIDSTILTVDLGQLKRKEDKSINLQGPNFKIDTRLNNSIPSEFKNYNQILKYSLTSSFQNLLNQLENKEIPTIIYDYIRPVSESKDETTYHFENFVHFGSATERLKNFKYKLSLIELYNKQVGEINLIPGATSTSKIILNNKETINSKKEKLIKGFDGYERFLYYTTGSNIFTWPKSDISGSLYPTTSSTLINWLGDERDAFSNYGGQLLSASLYDRQNEYALKNLIPQHIVDNPDNSFYLNFTHMIGHHFDQIWTYIKHITEINNTHHTKGISKDLVYFALKSLGLETFDQFENTNLIEYILGEGTSGSIFYDTPVSQSVVTASNAGSIPKGDITKEVWKRLYHNAPYLLKTKGTERGVKALMSCYGVPSTILNVKEYGGPTKDKTTYKTFSYEKTSLCLHGSSSDTSYFIKTDWSSSLTDALSSSAKTVGFRIKPTRTNNRSHLFSLSGSQPHTDPILVLTPWTGSDISSSNDSIHYGKLDLFSSGNIDNSTSYFPIFNGDFWNIFIGTDGDSGSNNGGATLRFGAYQSNFLKSVSYYTSSITITEDSRSLSWGDPYYKGHNSGGAAYAYIGGTEPNSSGFYNDLDTLRYTGSLQEVRYYFHSGSFETLSPTILKQQALEPFIYAGNTTSSAYNELILRLPLGSNLVCETDQTIDSSSFHPNLDIKYIPTNSISSSISGSYKEIIETHHLPTPDTVGISMTSEKVRIDEGTIDDDILSTTIRSENSTLDRQPQDFEDLGIFFSPTSEINEDIIYTLGAFRLDDYIGSPLPSAQTSSNYSDLRNLKNEYFKKVKRRFNYWDYIKTIQYIDHTLFKLIEQWVPFKANTKTGLLIEPHYLERTKFPRELPIIDDGQTMVSGSYTTIEADVKGETIDEIYSLASSSMGGGNVVTTNNLSSTTDSKGHRKEQGTNFTINVNGYILDENQEAAQAPIIPNSTGSKAIKRRSSTLLGNATIGRLSSKYYKFGEYYK
tara:strand:+ start:5375 stop:9130 length:3756 start_codon:yes stop_codon:yes gene_type:complete